MKKRFMRSLTAAMLSATMLFTACGSQPEATTTQTTPTTAPTAAPVAEVETPVVKDTPANFTVPAGGYDGSEVTVVFWHTMSQTLQGVLNDAIEEFNALYPNIHIQHSQVGGYDDVRDNISQKLPTGEEPNIAYCYPDHVALYNLSEGVVHLDNLIASTETVKRADGTTETLGLTDAQKADFIEGYYNEGLSYGDNHMYTLPFSKSTEVLYYNKTFFEENGLSVPTTWDEMETLIETIKEIDPESIPLGYDSEANWFITMTEQLGSSYTSPTGSHYIFNEQANRDFAKRFGNWYQNELCTTQTLFGSYTSGLFVATTGTKSYMSIGSSAGATHQRPDKVDGAYPFEVGITSIPQVNPSNPKVISQGPSVCVFNKANPQEVIASWLFIKYLTTSVEFQAAFSTASGYIPVIKSVSTNETYAAFLKDANGGDNIASLSVKVGLEQEAAYYVSPAFNGSSQARSAVGELLQEIFIMSNPSDADINAAFEAKIKKLVTSDLSANE